MTTDQLASAQTPAAIARFANPVIWEDLPDPEVIRVGDVYYMSASSFHFSPGAPLLQSHNLVDWEYVGHSVPELDFGERWSLNGEHPGSYVKGIWASTLRYRESNGLFYWYGAIQGTERTYVYTAKNPSDVWTRAGSIEKFYYDVGLLIDDDDTLYLAYGTKTISVSRLSPDGLKEIESKPVFTSDVYLEGARMYKIRGAYYIWLTKPFAGQYVLKSSSGPFGPYESRQVIGEIPAPIPGSGFPHQGALIDTPGGDWYYMAFMDGFPCGRIPLMAPVVFNSDGWPELVDGDSKLSDTWALEYPYIKGGRCHNKVKTCFRTHAFGRGGVEPCWEWNHRPDNSLWTVQDSGLVLKTGTVTDNLYLATNTLTHRTIGPKSMATFEVDTSMMADGDRAGASMFRILSAYIGIHKGAGSSRLVYVDDISISPLTAQHGFINGHPVALDWKVDSNGTTRAEVPLEQSRIWLRIKADVTSAHTHGYEKQTRYTTFSYSYDGSTFTDFGPVFALSNEATGFVGYRFALFNFATRALGGQISVKNCDIESWE